MIRSPQNYPCDCCNNIEIGQGQQFYSDRSRLYLCSLTVPSVNSPFLWQSPSLFCKKLSQDFTIQA
jgi:hypothetical protein